MRTASLVRFIRKINCPKTADLSKGEVKGVFPITKNGGQIMFYTKLTLSENSKVITRLSDKNVYSICPKCGKEIQVNLSDVLKEEDTDLHTTCVYCKSCAKKWLKEKAEVFYE